MAHMDWKVVGAVGLAVLAATVSEAGARTRRRGIDRSHAAKKALITVVNRMPDRSLNLWFRDTARDAGTTPPAVSRDFAQAWSTRALIDGSDFHFSLGSGFHIGNVGGFTGWFLQDPTPQGVWVESGDFDRLVTSEVAPGRRVRIVVDRDWTQFLGTDWDREDLAEGFLDADETDLLFGGNPPEGATTSRIHLDEVWTKAPGVRRLSIVVREPGSARVPGQPVPLLHE